ncbi:MAG: nucleotidyl transferase AbiEii/AbiGii toxin family protein [Actinobacteria bacterium]|nr:nucleotidyl transferase AbiEii/AbiGii toxin family protein [Actinomycetota bacterium]
MSNREVKDLSASVHRRLLNKAREENRPFNELLQYYAMERFLYRLSKSPYSEKFVLKGALMLVVWNAPPSRPTSDIDLLGIIENDVDAIATIAREICAQEVESDGITFDANSVSGETIAEVDEYQGVRVRIRGNLGPALLNIQLDVGFGDSVIPSPVLLTYPVLLDMPKPTLRGYSRESMIAEKLQSIARFGMLNSRMKDFFDIWLLSRQYGFDGKTLRKAIGKTFNNRGTDASPELIVLIDDFSRAEMKSSQWQAFCRMNRLESVPLNLEEVAQSIAEFISPLLSGESFEGAWTPPGPWVPV